jgi:hypothetical protein
MNGNGVLRVNGVEEQADYMEAVAEILRRIQVEHRGHDGKPITLHEIAEAVDISLTTISLAANKKTVLNSLYLNRLGKRFGPHTLDPFAALAGARMMPLDVSVTRDVLPFVAKVNLKIASARCPESPGGIREIHTEKADYLPDLRQLRKELDCLIHQIEGELAA